MNIKIEIPFRYKKIKDKYLITNDYFNWLFLKEDEFKKAKSGKIKKDSSLYKKLKSQNFIIDNNDQSSNVIYRRRCQSSLLFNGPTLHIIVLTKRCNQKCLYCHAASVNEDQEKFDLSKEDAKKFVEIIMSSPNKFLTIEFQGGEPMLNFEVLKYIYEYSQKLAKKKKKDVKYALVTNLQNMNNEKLNYLIENEIKICTSLDGPKKLHDKNRPSINKESSYDKVIYWINEGIKKKTRFGALITVSKHSLSYPKEIIDEYMKLQYSMLHLRPMNFLGNAVSSWDNARITAVEFIEFWKKAMEYIIELNKKGKFMTERTSNIILQKIINKAELNFLDLMSPCGAVIGQLAYNYDGNIYSCDEARTLEDEMFLVGNTKETTSIPKLVTEQKSIDIISSTINDSYYCDYCPYKAYCGVCPVCHYGETKTPISDVLRTSRCKILMAQFDFIFEKLQDPEIRKIMETWVDEKVYKKGILFE